MDKPKKEISIRDISKLSGVSIATVSRVINNNGRYSKETERRVLEIIEAYHYAPNLTARRLRTRQQNFVAVVVPDITNEFFACICQHLQEELLESGYLALLCNTAESMETQRQYLNMLGVVNLAGIIFVSGSTDTESGTRDIPTIYIDRTPPAQALEHSLVVESDNYGGAVLAARELYEKGCRRPLMLRSASPISTHDTRQTGFLEEMARCGVPGFAGQVVQVEEVTFQAARAKTLELVRQGADFDGIFCATDWLASGAVAGLEEAGVQVPEQVRIIGFDDISIARLAAKPITTIHQNIEQIAQTAVRELLNIIAGKDLDADRLQIGVELIRRKTT